MTRSRSERWAGWWLVGPIAAALGSCEGTSEKEYFDDVGEAGAESGGTGAESGGATARSGASSGGRAGRGTGTAGRGGSPASGGTGATGGGEADGGEPGAAGDGSGASSGTGGGGTGGGGSGSPATGGTGAGGGGAGLTGAGGTVAGASAGGSAGAPAGSGTLGDACNSTADCAAGLRCLTSNETHLSGGPAGGLCTSPCTTDNQCVALQAGSYCVGFTSSASYCLQGCTVGSAGVPKCEQRSNVACSLIGLLPSNLSCTMNGDCPTGQLCSTAAPRVCGDIVTGCVPQCRGDFDCAGGYCNFSTGFCSTVAPTGLPIGSPCTPGADPDPCNGFCLASDTAGTVGSCSAFCAFASDFTGCGWDGQGAASAGCLYSTVLSTTDLGAGDVGMCGKLCDCNDDCPLANERCVDESGGTVMAIFGRPGYCRPLATGETEADTFACN